MNSPCERAEENALTADALKTNALNAHLTSRPTKDLLSAKAKSGYEVQAVYEFRPLPNVFLGNFRRYANGEWLADDGEYDIAFIGKEAEHGASICLMFEPSYQRNIIAKWLTAHWSSSNFDHPRANPWHHMLRPGELEWGGDWGRDRHENYQAGRRGMNKMSSEFGCSNGRHVEPTTPGDPHILAGLVRDRETKAILIPPQHPACMYCGDVYGAACEAVSGEQKPNGKEVLPSGDAR